MRAARAALSVAALFAAAPAVATDLPSRKPGLWELRTTFLAPARAKPTVYRHCIDAATDREMLAPSGMLRRNACQRMDVCRDGDTLLVGAECRSLDGKEVPAHNVITGSFDDAYTMRRTVPVGTPPVEEVELIEAKWLGPCEGDQKPGDVISERGAILINLRAYQAMLENSLLPGMGTPPAQKP